MEENSPVEYSESEGSEDINDSALIHRLCKKYKFPALLDSGSNPSTVTLPFDESEFDITNESDVNIPNDSYVNIPNDSEIEESSPANSRIKNLRRKLAEIDSEENTNGRYTEDDTDIDLDGVGMTDLEYLNVNRRSLKRQLDLMVNTDMGLPKNAVTFFSSFRCFVFTNQTLALLNVFLEIIIIIGIYHVSFPWKIIVVDETANQYLSVVYFIEVTFPVFLAMYGIFAGAFDPSHLRTFSRMAVCHVIFFNFLKLCISYIFYSRAFDGSMEREMQRQMGDYFTSMHLDFETSWDRAQKYLGCCGINNYKDWRFPNKSLHLPTSCCSSNNTFPGLKQCIGLAKERPGCRLLIQEHMVGVLAASVVINWLQLIFLTAAILLAFRVWNIICNDEEYTGSPGWKEARVKFQKQSQLSFFFVCVPNTCCKYESQNFDTKVYPM